MAHGPDRILFIRHAEHHSQLGITEDGMPDDQSLNARGWQRAGALIARLAQPANGDAPPDAIYASAITEDGQSRRPQQTVAPLLAFLRARGHVTYCDAYAKTAVDELAEDLMTRKGVVLVAWEHSMIPKIARRLGAKSVPSDWPTDRYDMIWRFDRSGDGWSFEEIDQGLLVGDR